MILIVHDFPSTGLTNGFRAVKGRKPIKLPDNVGVIEFINGVAEINIVGGVEEKTTFSIVFSPSGKLVIRNAPVLRTDMSDSIFNDPNSPSEFMFIDDYFDSFPFWQEDSRGRFTIYEKNEFDSLDGNGKFDYIANLDLLYINSYTGTVIEK